MVVDAAGEAAEVAEAAEAAAGPGVIAASARSVRFPRTLTDIGHGGRALPSPARLVLLVSQPVRNCGSALQITGAQGAHE